MAPSAEPPPERVVRDPYEVLGISPNASDEEVRAAYGRLVRYYDRNPDDSPWAQEHMREIREAYATLSDRARRADVDAGSDGSEQPAGLREPAPAVASAVAPSAAEAAPVAAPPPRRSRNPIDRLTRGLPRPWRIAIDWIVTIAGAIAIVLAIKAWIVNPYRIPTSSMEPTLHCAGSSGCEAHLSDRVLANRFIYHFRSPERKEIVVFKTPEKARQLCGAGGTFVKRLIGLPGDTVTYQSNILRVNGKVIDEPYVRPGRAGGIQGTWHVHKGQYFFMGDNRASSCDSRTWGGVPKKNLIGEVFLTYWPPNRIAIHAVWLPLLALLPFRRRRRS
jgi:signal peptidase I